jgi:hypothetical protein
MLRSTALVFRSRNTRRTVTLNAKVKVQCLSLTGRILGTPLKNTGHLWTLIILGNKNKQEYLCNTVCCTKCPDVGVYSLQGLYRHLLARDEEGNQELRPGAAGARLSGSVQG